MLLVTGSTGTTGMEVLQGAQGPRRRGPRAGARRDEGASPARPRLRAGHGRPRRPAHARPGARGRRAAPTSCSPIGPMQSEFEQAFLETAKEAGVKHVVKLSVIGASPEAPLRFARTHAKVEQALRDSGMDWTLLRPTSFMQNTLSWGARVLDGTFYSPVPDAAFSIVDARDVAEVAAVALTEEGHEGKAYGLSGPEAVSYRDQAKRVFAAAGREIDGRGDPGRGAQARARPGRRPALERRGPERAVRALRRRRRADGDVRRQGRAGPRPAHDRRIREGPRGRIQGAGMTEGGAWGAGLATYAGDRILEVFYPDPQLGGEGESRVTELSAEAAGEHGLPEAQRDGRAARRAPGHGAHPHRRPLARRRATPPTPTCACTCSATGSSSRTSINLDGIFGALPNVAWTSVGPGRPREPDRRCSSRPAPSGIAAAGLQRRQVPAHDRLRRADRRARRRRRPRAPRRPPRRGHDGHARGLRELQRRHARHLDGRGPHQRGRRRRRRLRRRRRRLDHGHAVRRRHRGHLDRRALPARRERRHRHLARRRVHRRGRALHHGRHA